MNELTPKVIIIPANPEMCGKNSVRRRQLRVAAYCRVSTDDKDQLSSYETQKAYYIDTIMKNSEWTFVDIYADEGLSGTQAKKRKDFLRMIRHCKQGKIDMILVKSISRFARNTVDCLKYVRLLRDIGTAVFFETQNINSLQEDSEFLITLHGAFAQQESESISANVRWGKRQAMREGKAIMIYKNLYALQRGEDGRPEIIPEQAAVVRDLYSRFLAGDSLRMLRDRLMENCTPNVHGEAKWTLSSIRNILTNEKYCGDVLLQKTFISDCISKKSIKNTGQLPMYLIQNHHAAIVDRNTFQMVQTELARRNASASPSKKAPTGRSCYASKYALSECLVCGECGTLYRRCTWSKKGKKHIVWRCVSRLDFGTKYCQNSPSMDEAALQQAILAAINRAMSNKQYLISQITGAMEREIAPISGEYMSISTIDVKLEELNARFGKLLPLATENGSDDYKDQFQNILSEITVLKEKRTWLEQQLTSNVEARLKIENARRSMEDASSQITEWDEATIRQLVETVKVLSASEIEVTLKGGIKVQQEL